MRKPFVGLLALALTAIPTSAQLAAPNRVGVSFAHVHLSVADLDLHRSLWTELFEAELLEEAGFTAVGIRDALVFFTVREPSAPSIDSSVDHFGFTVRDMGAVLTRWRSMGYTVDREFTGPDGEAKAYITVPDGIRLELEEDPDLSAPAAMHHVHYYAVDHRGLRDWYQDLFAATPRARGAIETTADVPGTNLSFSHVDEPRLPTNGTSVDHVGFEVDDMEAFAGRLRSRGIEFEREPFLVESLGIWVAFFIDPSGTRVEVSEGLDEFGR